MRQGVEVQLGQSPFLSLVSEDRIQQALHQMGQPPDTHITGPLAREVCVRTGSAALIEGSIQNVGTRYVLSFASTDCRTGEVIDRQQVPALGKEDVLGAISVMTSRFRERVGESRDTLQKHDVPLAEAIHQHLARRKKIASRRHLTDAALLVHISALYAEDRGAHGWARIWRELIKRGIHVGKQRVQRLMQKHGIRL